MARGIPRILKLRIWIRDGFICQYCGRLVKDMNNSNGGPLPPYAATVDHIIPRSKGGREVPENIVTACFRCNNLLKDKFETFEEKKKFIQENTGYMLQLDEEALKRWERHVNRKALHRRRRG